MIGKVLKASPTAHGALDYNEKKVMRGDAELVDYANLPDDLPSTIEWAFDELLENPAVTPQSRSRVFHMTIGPGIDDDLSPEKAKELIADVMKKMGYGEQPYVVYYHHDIDRGHYHVVAPRVKKDGRLIDSSFEGRKLTNILKELAGKYNYTFGKKEGGQGIQPNLPVVKHMEFKRGDANVRQTLVSLFEEALKYDFHSLFQFGSILLSMNIRLTMRKRKDGTEAVILEGLDERGNRATMKFSMEKNFGLPGAEIYRKRLEENNRIGVLQLSRKVAVKEVSDFCLEETASADEYCKAIEEAGIRHVMLRDENTNEIKRVVLVDKSSKTIIDTAIKGELFKKSFLDAEENGHWAKPRKTKKKHTPGGKIRTKDDKTFFTADRNERLAIRVKAAVEKFNGITPAQKPTKPGIALKNK